MTDEQLKTILDAIAQLRASLLAQQEAQFQRLMAVVREVLPGYEAPESEQGGGGS